MRVALALRLLLALICVIHFGCGPELSEPGSKTVSTAVPSSAPSQSSKREQVIAPIAWPAPALIDVGARSSLSKEAREVVERAALPVWVLPATVALQRAKLMAKPNWYALSSRFDGLAVALSGSRLTYRYANVAAADGPARVRGRPAFVGHNAGIWSVAWRAHGAAYSLDVECAQGADPRCATERFVLELADDLRYVGGAQQGATP